MTSGGAAYDAVAARRRSSVLAQDAVMCRTAGSLFLLGGVVNVLVLVVQSSRSATAAAVLATLSAAVGVWLLAPRRHLSDRLLHILLGFATVLISAESVLVRDPIASVLVATLSVFVSVAAFFFGWSHLLGHLILVTVCAASTMAAHPGLTWQVGVAVSGFVVALTVMNKLFLDMAVAAEFDALTGLPNRRGFDRHLASWLARAENSEGAALILIGIDAPGDGSTVSDGEATLLSVLDAWGPVLDAGERRGRRDDAQIAILCPRENAEGALALVERLRSVAPVDCTVGLTTWREGDSADLLIARAETALLRAKLAADGRTVVDAADLASDARLVRRALADGALEIVYQPIIGLSPGHPLVAIEALLRWIDARPALSPQALVQIAEQSGFAAELDDFVLRTACRDALQMQRALGVADLMLNVNVSLANLVDRDLVGRVDSLLDDIGWPAKQLTFEVTEGMLDLRGGNAVWALRAFRSRGICIAVDDFGTGYSSLSRLQALPVDRLKLDKSITDLVSPSCGEAPALLTAVAAISAALDLPVTVEGVETRRQMEILTQIGFDQAQGFLFGIARGVDAFVEAAGSTEHWWDPERYRREECLGDSGRNELVQPPVDDSSEPESDGMN